MIKCASYKYFETTYKVEQRTKIIIKNMIKRKNLLKYRKTDHIYRIVENLKNNDIIVSM